MPLEKVQDDAEIDNQIDAGVAVGRTYGIDTENDFARYHRRRRRPEGMMKSLRPKLVYLWLNITEQNLRKFWTL